MVMFGAFPRAKNRVFWCSPSCQQSCFLVPPSCRQDRALALNPAFGCSLPRQTRSGCSSDAKGGFDFFKKKIYRKKRCFRHDICQQIRLKWHPKRPRDHHGLDRCHGKQGFCQEIWRNTGISHDFTWLHVISRHLWTLGILSPKLGKKCFQQQTCLLFYRMPLVDTGHYFPIDSCTSGY